MVSFRKKAPKSDVVSKKKLAMENPPPADCPLTRLVDIIGGRWKVLSLWRLLDGTKRFNELRRLMPGVTQKMLTQQLRQLEADGLISRKIYAEVPPRVEYRLTKTGEELGNLLVTLSEWATVHMPTLEAGRAQKQRAILAKKSARKRLDSGLNRLAPFSAG